MVDDTQRRPSNREGGVSGRLPPIGDDVDGTYSISFRSGRAYLEIVVLMRCICAPSKGDRRGIRSSQPVIPSSGANIGPHIVAYVADTHELYVDGALVFVPSDENIVCIQEQPERLVVVNTGNLGADLAALDSRPGTRFRTRIAVVDILHRRLMTSTIVQDFCRMLP